MEIVLGIFCLAMAGAVALWGITQQPKRDWLPLITIFLMLGSFGWYITDFREPANRFKDFFGDINLRQVSIVGSDIFERKIRITYENGKLVSVVAVPKTIVKIEAPEPEKKVEGK